MTRKHQPRHVLTMLAVLQVGALCAMYGLAGGGFQLEAQAPAKTSYVHLNSTSLGALEKKLMTLLVTSDKTKAVNETLSPALATFNPNHRAILFHRDAASFGEIHEDVSDFAMVKSGSGSIVIGGKVLNPRVDSPGEIRGPGLEGGKTVKLSQGDVLFVPAKMPHQFVPDPGKALSVFVFKPLGMLPHDEPANFVLWTASQLDDLDRKLATKLDETKGANETLATNGDTNKVLDNRRALLFHRKGSGPGEVHEKVADFAYVRSGSGSLLLGGKLTAGKAQAGGEIRGSGVEGGTQVKLAAGDVVYVPANLPHRFVVDPGQSLSVVVLKFR